MTFFSSFIVTCFIRFLFLTIVNGQLRPIVNVQTIPDGGIFNITCDASRVNIPEKDSGVTKLLSLVVNVMNSDSQTGTPVAQYIPSAGVEIKNPPTGRNWIIDFSGYNNGTNNRNTMRIEILVRDAKCTDAGNYSCVVQYVSNIVNTQTMSQNVTAEAAIKEPVLTVNPLISGTNDSRNYTILSLDANNITMICRMDGPENVAIKWKREIRPSMGNDISYEIYPYENDISTKPAEVVTSTATSCSVYHYESTLKFTVTERRRNYLCVGQMNNVDMVTTGFTVDLDEGGGQQTANPQTNRAGDDKPVGLIVGVVVGCGVAIIIAVIIGVICYRRRSRKGNNKDNTDRPDGGAAPHEPYAVSTNDRRQQQGVDGGRDRKTHTGRTNDALNTSYDSTNKAPPVYSISNNNEPPRQKDINRGRQNIAYDEDSSYRPPRQGQDPHYYNYEDGPQNQRFSAEDGTDGRAYDFGDPNMGTGV